MSDVTTTGMIEVSQDDKMMAMLACILGIVTSWVGPLIIFLIKKDQSKFVAFHALQMTIFQVALIVLHLTSMFTFGLGSLAAFILALVFGIIAALAANRGEWYEIPVVGKFAKQQVGISG